MTTTLTIGARLAPTDLDFPGQWSVWSQAADAPGAYFLVPLDEEARELGVKYAVVKALMGRSSTKPTLSLIRTDPARNDLVEADLDRRNRMKEKR